MFDGSGRVISGYKYWYGQLYYFHAGTYTKAVTNTFMKMATVTGQMAQDT